MLWITDTPNFFALNFFYCRVVCLGIWKNQIFSSSNSIKEGTVMWSQLSQSTTIVVIDHNCRNTNHNCRNTKHNCRNCNHNCRNRINHKFSTWLYFSQNYLCFARWYWYFDNWEITEIIAVTYKKIATFIHVTAMILNIS